MQTIGFIGVGNIGMAICKHLIDSGHNVLGYRRSSLAEFEKIGGIAAKSPADVGSQVCAIRSGPALFEASRQAGYNPELVLDLPDLGDDIGPAAFICHSSSASASPQAQADF